MSRGCGTDGRTKEKGWNYEGSGFPGGSHIKNPPAMGNTRVGSLGWKDPLEKGMTTHSSILAWRIPRTEDWYPAVLIGPQRVRHA